jgi:hypothetical protein
MSETKNKYEFTLNASSILFAVGIMLICMKLGGTIDWDWWIVLIPAVAPFAATLIVLAVLAVVAVFAFLFLGFAVMVESIRNWWSR